MMTEISRRSVAKGAAWSIPAIAVASAAPAMAASVVTPTKVATLQVGRSGTSYLSDGSGDHRMGTTLVALDGADIPAGTTVTISFSESGLLHVVPFDFVSNDFVSVVNGPLERSTPQVPGNMPVVVSFSQDLTITTLQTVLAGTSVPLSQSRLNTGTETIARTVYKVNPVTQVVGDTTVNVVIKNQLSAVA